MTFPHSQSAGPDETVWQPPEQWPSAEHPPHWRWLIERGSLTERISSDLGAPVTVELISERRDANDGDLDREVRLHVDECPIVYAISRIPGVLIQRIPWLASLGHQPLGERFFELPGAERDRLQIARLTPQHPLVECAWSGMEAPGSMVWARRSRLVTAGTAITITECFMDSAQLTGVRR